MDQLRKSKKRGGEMQAGNASPSHSSDQHYQHFQHYQHGRWAISAPQAARDSALGEYSAARSELQEYQASY